MGYIGCAFAAFKKATKRNGINSMYILTSRIVDKHTDIL